MGISAGSDRRCTKGGAEGAAASSLAPSCCCGAPAASFTPLNNQPYNHHTITAPPRLRMEPPSARPTAKCHNGAALSHTRTLRAAGSLQGVPPSCCGRRVAVWSGVCRSGAQGQAARRASSLRTWRWRVRRSPCPSCPTTNPPYVPRPSAVDHLDRDMLQR